jgi:hypothetical protein
VKIGTRRNWLQGALLVVACGAIYLELRPPLFDRDGYAFRLYAQAPDRFYQVNPHHLLWNAVQIFLVRVTEAIGYHTTVPFQLFGVAVNCITLFAFYLLLLNCNDSRAFAAAGTLLVAFSPWYWFLGFQNRPYPLIFLFIVLYLTAWHTADENPPSGLRLLSAGLSLTGVIFLQQAAILLVPAATVVLAVRGCEPVKRRLIRAGAWGSSMTVLVATVYAAYARALGIDDLSAFIHWTRGYLETLHSFQIRFPASIFQSMVGIFGTVAKIEPLDSSLLDRFSPATMLDLYGAAGAIACLAVAMIIWRADLSRSLRQLVRRDALFLLSVLSILSWAGFVLAYAPANEHFWVLNLFPVLVCAGLVLRRDGLRLKRMFAASVLLLSLWNVYFNHSYDLVESRNFPEPLMASVEQHVGPRDVFLILGIDSWFGGVNYELLFLCLNHSPNNPGIAVLNDFVMPAGGMQTWRAKLGAKIDSTLDSGGRVFVAAHVLNADSYDDLSHANDPFAEFTIEKYEAIDGGALYQQVRQFFDRYELRPAQFSIGADSYFSVAREGKRRRLGETP